MKRRIFSPLCIAILLFTGNAIAQQPAKPPTSQPLPETIKAIMPFLDQAVMAVVRIDTAKVDLKAAEGWLGARIREGAAKDDKRVDEFLKDAADWFAEGQKMLSAFREAGGRDAYVVVSTVDVFSGPPAVVIPLPPGADGDKIAKLFPPDSKLERINNVLILGSDAAHARLREMLKAPAKPMDPSLMAAMAEAGPDSAVHVAIAPSVSVRAIFAQLAPTLPPQLGGGATGPVVRGLRWATLSLQMPPTPSLRMLIQAETPQAAEAMEKVAGAGLAESRKKLDEQAALPKNAGEADSIKRLADMVPKISPKRDGDRLAILLDERNMMEMVSVAANGILRARQQAMQVQSMTQMRQVLVACQMWTAEHKGEWPDDIATAIKSAGLPETMAAHPSNPDVRYTYVKPSKDSKDASTRIVLYEAEDFGGRRGVGFMDGHAEQMPEEQFNQLLKKQAAEAKK